MPLMCNGKGICNVVVQSSNSLAVDADIENMNTIRLQSTVSVVGHV
jgi:hypothetical protein